ncbi:MAG TPA: Fic family protein [Candidatus Sulfopaludibacter sp.]|nr:Fic family protein [Candidatus Sulfopaludibacter sp.]
MPESSDPYTYPETDVLRNIPGIRDPRQLAAFEANTTAVRLIELDERPLAGQFDSAHLRAIQRYVFQDVYRWAGEFRTVNIAKGGQFFGAAAFIEPALHEGLRKLAGERFLLGLAPATFSTRAGHYLGKINAIHPFRDGNGRTQREFIRELALQAGFQLDWSRVTREQMMAASAESFRSGDSSVMAALIEQSLVNRAGG